MSAVYWGIVAGLVAMVGTFFVCIGLVYSKTKGSPPASNGKVGELGSAAMPASIDRRRAA
jgi:hypothetical protein